jgi:hypothetical protein
MNAFDIRPATIQDIASLVQHRRGMYADMGYDDKEAMAKMAVDRRSISDRRFPAEAIRAGLRLSMGRSLEARES